ncbi:MAG: Uma2 family endonuclease [Desulfamplus sp.]|nr:Uma2 family endonuclease [Desulfamplus sp.]
MTLPQQKVTISPNEYLEIERTSEVKHEYFDGEIFAMVGASVNHNRINTNVIVELGGRLKAAGSACTVFSNDMRVKVEEAEKYTYPDVSVVCGEIELEKVKGLETLLNPVVIIEILSSSTELYDRVKKFEHYQLIDSFREYILISQDRCRVESYVQGDNTNWTYTAFTNMDQVIVIESINCELPLSEIYYRVKFHPLTVDE